MQVLDKGRISEGQLAFLVLGFVLGSSLILPPGGGAGRDGWAASLMGLVISLPMVFVYVILSKRYPGRSFVEICLEVFGTVVGRVVALPFLWFLLHLASLVLTNIVYFFTTTIMENTPSGVISLSVALVVAYAVHSGIEGIGRTAQVVIPVILVMGATSILLGIPEMDFAHLRPFLDLPMSDFIGASFAATTFPFAETVAFLMITPLLAAGSRSGRGLYAGLVLGGVLLSIMSLTNTLTLGGTTPYATYPTFQSVRLVELAGVISRLEVIVALSFISTVFFKLSVLVYGLASGTAQLLGLRATRPILGPLVVYSVVMSLSNFRNVAENIHFAERGWLVYAPLFQVGLPAFVLIMAMALGKKGEEQ